MFTTNKFSYKGIHEGTQQEKIVKSRWVSKIAYVDSAGIVELTFAPDVIPLITQLEKSFTAYELKQISSLTSKYAIRLYELLIQWRSVGKTPLFELGKHPANTALPSDPIRHCCK